MATEYIWVGERERASRARVIRSERNRKKGEGGVGIEGGGREKGYESHGCGFLVVGRGFCWRARRDLLVNGV